MLYAPDSKWRCKEDLKVILITKNKGLTQNTALSFFKRFGKVTDCYILTHDRIACGEYTSEEDAEKALSVRAINLNGMYCDVTTFKSGNRKIFISGLTLSEQSLRSYFEANYGPMLRFELLPGNTAAFILFLKVDSAVACRNKYHMINGVSVHARPGCTPGTHYVPGRSSMYRVVASAPSASFRVDAPSFQPRVPSSISNLSPIDVINDLSRSNKTVYDCLLEEMKDISIDESNEKRKRAKKNVNIEPSIIRWKIEQEEYKQILMKKKAKLTVAPPLKIMGRIEEVNEKMEKEVVSFKEKFGPSDKSVMWEKRRVELNLPPINPCAHYSLDEDGFPLHYNGKYVHSILRDGRFRFRVESRVSFKTDRNTVKKFIRDATEYNYFGPNEPSTTEKMYSEHGEDDIEGWEDDSVVINLTRKGKLSHRLLKWPVLFPAQPRHFPLMEHCTFEDKLSLEGGNFVRYKDHLEARWRNTKQSEFFTAFAPFLKPTCDVCNVTLDGPKKQFEHIFSRPHLENMNRHKVKFTPSDFTFWNNMLLNNFHTGVKRKR